MTSVQRRLSDVATFINGVAFKPADWSSAGRRIIRIQNLTDSSKLFNRTTREVDPKYWVKPGDLMVSWSATLGVFEWEGPDTALVNQHIFRVVHDEEVVFKSYLRYALEGALSRMWRHLHGSTMKHVNRGEFLATKIPLPPLAEQRRIAAMLDKADAIRQKRREAIGLLDEFLRSAFLEMFGDPVTNPKGWEVVALQQLVDPDRPITYGILKPGPDQQDGIPYVRVVDMVDGGIRTGVRRTTVKIAASYVRSTLRPNDLLMSIRGHVGRLAVVPEWLDRGNITQDTARLALVPDISFRYALGCLRSKGMQHLMARFVKGVAVRGINLGDVKKLPVPVPPAKQQEQYAELEQTSDRMRQYFRQSAAQSNDLFNSLAQRAFGGGANRE